MTRKKIKFSHTKWLLPLWVLLIGSIVLYMIAHAVQQDDSRHLRTLAELNAVTYGDSMIRRSECRYQYHGYTGADSDQYGRQNRQI